ncbi:MAG: prolyl oligopeptidase family serine peptidase [Candidatus Acidiferrum sp.]
MRKSFFLLFSLFLLFGIPAHAKKSETGFLDRSLAIHGTTYKYQVFIPDNWSRNKKWPIILFLHGSGERGEDGLLQTEVGLPAAVRRERSRFPAIIVIPQCRKEVWWLDSPMDDIAIQSLEATQKEFQGDLRRTYLTGLSMGGYGTWALAAKYPGRFAALVPICGGIIRPEDLPSQSPSSVNPYEEAAKKIGSATPIWIFHGSADDSVPVTESQQMTVAMKALGGEVHYTEYPGVGHDSWDNAYAEPDLMTWLLSKSTAAPRKK